MPEIKECNEIVSYFERAFKSGALFKIELSRNFGDYRIFVSKDVILKSSQHGGERLIFFNSFSIILSNECYNFNLFRFGYPDQMYIDDLLRKARSFK